MPLKRSIGKVFLALFWATTIAVQPASGEDAPPLWLPAIFGDHMVLQRDCELPVWGRANPGATVEVAVGDRFAQTTADAAGDWRVRLKPLSATVAPVELRVTSEAWTRTFGDVLIGDVWLCSGQSNMGMGIGQMAGGKEVVDQANHPQLRLFQVERHVAFEPSEAVKGRWLVCTPETLAPLGYGWGGFSAIGYYFGADLLERKGVPVGMIGSYVGGTRIHCWSSLDVLERITDRRSDTFSRVEEFKDKRQSLEPRMADYLLTIKPEYDAAFAKWREEHSEKQAEWVKARTEAQTAGNPAPPRPVRTAPPKRTLAPDAEYILPTVLFNGMINPIIPYAIKGVLWYQGEANCYPRQNEEYAHLFPLMIQDWRTRWEQGDFPFIFVQLPNRISHGGGAQYKDWWPTLRESQRRTLSLPKTAMVVAIDVGDPNDLHPKVKKPIAERLVLAARHVAYGEAIVHSGPMADTASLRGNQVVVSFTHVGGGLISGTIGDDFKVLETTAPLALFELAGDDGVFEAAQARIEGDAVVVWSDRIARPVAVRYAWMDNPVPPADVYNREGFPASPFLVNIDD